MIDCRSFTVGPVAENCYFVRRPRAAAAVVIDPGEEADRLIGALAELGITQVAGILLTHTHFDHVGAVAALTRATGAEVWCPALEREVLANINDYVPVAYGLGPFEPYEAEHTLAGGETLTLADLTFEVRFTPGHSPGHLSYRVRDEGALFSGDVLFAGSVGRVDLPGGDWPTLLASIGALIDEFPAETVVHPGHMGDTTLGRERATNPYLRELTHS